MTSTKQISRRPRRCERPAEPTFAASLLEGFLDYLQAECGLAVNTRLAYRRDLRKFFTFLAEIDSTDPTSVTTADIEGFLRYLRGLDLAVSSAARALAAVKMFFRYLVLIGQAPRDVTSAIDSPKKWHRLPTVLDDQTVRKLLDSPDPDQDAHALRDRAILRLLYATGIRASELTGLQISDINFHLGIVRVLGKGEKERIVPVADEAIQAVQCYIQQVHTDPLAGKKLFLSRRGKAMRREDIFRLVRKYVRRAAISGNVSPHTLRHCFATQLLANGAGLRSVQEMLGHADIATTQVYTHVDTDRLKSIHKKFHPRG